MEINKTSTTRTLTLSVLIATMNRPSDVKRALDSVLRQTRLPDEVVIIDQSTDNRTRIAFSETKTEHARSGVRFHYVYQEEKSLVLARNRGLDESSGDVVSFLDDDVVLFPDYFFRVMTRFEAEPDLGGVSGNTLVDRKPSGWKWVLRKAVMRLFLLSDFKGRMTPSGFGYPVYEREIEDRMSVDFLPGCNMNYRRESVGSDRFDEWFTGYGFREDVDFSYRISRRSRLEMIPDAKLQHLYSTANRLDLDKLKRMETRNYHYLFLKYKGGRPLARVFFVWSLFGLTMIELLEFVTSGKPMKFSKWRAGIGSSMSLISGRG